MLTAERISGHIIISNIRYISAFYVMTALIILIAGCSKSAPEPDDRCLIRVGGSTVTVQDYYDAFEIAKVAYTHNAIQDSHRLKAVQFRLLNQLSDEMILLERAKALGIEISDVELEAAISQIKADYPEGMFQQTLFNSAISFSRWVQRMKTRLIIDKVVEKDLTEGVDITPDDVASFLKDHSMMEDALLKNSLEDLNGSTVAILRRKKAEETYHEWMQELKQNYTVEINQDLWAKIADH